MIRTIHIKNIILIDSLTLELQNGFTVLTGETGSGKSAFLLAISLSMGQKADLSIIREGAEEAIIEVVYETSPVVEKFFQKKGFDIGCTFSIRRKIFRSGKSRASINDQTVSLQFLKELSALNVQFIGQHDYRLLFDLAYHRNVLDIYGDISLEAFQKSWEEEKLIKSRLLFLEKEKLIHKDLLSRYIEELQELEEFLKGGQQEESLFQEYEALHKEEEVRQLVFHLTEEFLKVEGQLKALFRQFQPLSRLEPSFDPQIEHMQSCVENFKEIRYFMERYPIGDEMIKERLQEVNERLTNMHRLKRKYGVDLVQVKKELKEKIEYLENLDVNIEELKEKVSFFSFQNQNLAKEISKKRGVAAKNFAEELTKMLQFLHMQEAELIISLKEKECSEVGIDHVEFFLAPNVGEKMVSVKSGASGGELSRLLLAIQFILSDKMAISTSIFDEIDSNIGGQTAHKIGKRLKELGKKRQIISISHFYQVALLADHHYQMQKLVKEERTHTTLQKVEGELKDLELHRLLGGEDLELELL